MDNEQGMKRSRDRYIYWIDLIYNDMIYVEDFEYAPKGN